MSLAGGARLGPYEILSPLGAGGMGEVYKARDIRLDRTVAVKVLPDGAAALPEVRQRFEREARAVSALNHPNICSLFDIGSQEGIDYLVMEFLEGETLAERVRNGPLPIGQALRYGIEIAGALEAAHRHGVIHRDLKPANIMIMASGPKILDFGLAKIQQQRLAVVSGGSEVPTITTPLTGRGTIVGTLQYMAPEQLEGKDADTRTDLFAFGELMYEMITGCRAFQASSQAALISSIMMAEPPALSTVQPLASASLEHVVRTCLSKDPADRWQSAHDVLVQLKWISSVGSQVGIAAPAKAQRHSRERSLWSALAVLTLAVVTLGFLYLRTPPDPVPMRLQIDVPWNFNYAGVSFPVLSPDGRHLAFTGSTSPGRASLWIRSLDNLGSRLLAGTEDANNPFWSPDARFVAFFADRKLKKVDLVGSPPQTICEISSRFGTGTWNPDGAILFSSLGNALRVVSAMGGEPKPALSLDRANHEDTQWWPCFLPDGRHFLYGSRNQAGNEIRAGKLGSIETRRVLPGVSRVAYSPPGLLVFGQQQTLMAQRFNAAKLQVTGDPFFVAGDIPRGPVGPSFSVSQTGLLTYHGSFSESNQLVSFNRDGARTGVIGRVLPAKQMFLSPDERRLSIEIRDDHTTTFDIWLLELSSNILSRVTSDPGSEEDPVWSPDGKELVFTSGRDSRASLSKKSIGGPPEKPFFESTERIYPTQWLSDGSIIFMDMLGKTFYRIGSTGGKPIKLFENEFEKDGPAVSPDGRWVAYSSFESGRWEVKVASFPEFTGQRQISDSGGCQPQWRKDSREIFYLTLEGKLMSAELRPGSALDALPRPLFQTAVRINPRLNQYAVTGDGHRFLVLESAEHSAPPMTLVVNWTAGLGR